MVSKAITEVTGLTPKLSTTGGTSDARFIKDYCPVIEFGLLSQQMHKIDEHVATADLVALTAIYRHILERYFEFESLMPVLARKIEPFRDIGIDESREYLRRVRRGLGALLGEALSRLRQSEHAGAYRR